MTTSHPSLPVPDEALLPLVEAAADVLRGLEPADVPGALRPVHGFDRRGLLSGPGRRQLLRCFGADEHFRGLVTTAFLARTEVQATLDAWSIDRAVVLVEEMAARHDLPLLASTLYAGRPERADFGLGLVAARTADERQIRADADASKEQTRERTALEENLRRSELARFEAETAVARLTEELQKERGERRARETAGDAQLRSTQRDLDSVQDKLRMATDAIEEEQLRTTREVRRAHALEADVRRMRGELDLARDRAAMTKAALDARELASAASEAEQLAGRLRDIERKMKTPVAVRPARERPPAPATRTVPDLPPGLAADAPAGLEGMLRTPDVVLAIDGYNVTKLAWPDATAADQRERLAVAVTALHRRLGCQVTIVFDGDGSPYRAPLRREGIRVLFSDAQEEADELLVRVVAGLPKRMPVVVASSDAWVREHAAHEGAVVVGAAALIRIARPDR
jgi:predicted RNA-binding protein with PIN domain